MSEVKKNEIVQSIEDGNRMLVSLGREVLDMMTKASVGGFFKESEQLADIYSHIEKARKAATRALELAVTVG
jgi:hypothetical protein